MSPRDLTVCFFVFVFGALAVTADEILGTALEYGPKSLYYFPIIGPKPIWTAWELVFAGIAFCFFACMGLLMLPEKISLELPKIHAPKLPSLPTRTTPQPVAADATSLPVARTVLGDNGPERVRVGDTDLFEITTNAKSGPEVELKA